MSEPDPRAAFEEALGRVLAAHITGFRALCSCERLSNGASQETYRIVTETDDGERRLAMRRAPGGAFKNIFETGPGLRVEALLIAAAREASVPEPEIVHILEAEDDLGEGFIMEWLDGETLGAKIARGEELARIRPALARSLGRMLARIHDLDVAKAGLAELLPVRTPEELVRESWNAYAAHDTPQPMIDYAARWLVENLPEPGAIRLVHGDFRNGNLIVHPEKGVVAVLDWELAHLGDPVRDLGWVCTNSWRFGRSDLWVGGFGTLEDLLGGYAEVSGRRVDLAHVRFWMVFGAFWWSVACLSMAHTYRTGLDRTVERAAVGRRSSEGQVDLVALLFPAQPHGRNPPSFEVATVLESLRESTQSSPSAAGQPRDEQDEEPATPSPSRDLPRADELVESVRDFLRQEVMPATRGRTSFLARVAGNSLDVVVRELALGPAARERERERLVRIFGREGDLETLRAELVRGLRNATIPLDWDGLADHLRRTVVDQVAIDQPQYSGLRAATR